MKHLSVFENWDDFEENFLGGEMGGPHVSYIKEDDWVEYIPQVPKVIERYKFYVEDFEFLLNKFEQHKISKIKMSDYDIEDQELWDYLSNLYVKHYPDGYDYSSEPYVPINPDNFILDAITQVNYYPGDRLYFATQHGTGMGWLCGIWDDGNFRPINENDEKYGYFYPIPF